MVLAHIGDSRAFMVRDGVVTQITKDHSFVQNLVDEGRITADEAQSHPQRSLVTRVLTGAHEDEPDLVVRQGRIGDRYVIASDGLTDYVARDTIGEVLTDTPDPGETADRLVALALRAGAPDNVTVVVGDLVDIGIAPPTQPQVVGAAAVRQSGTRPIPTTPAAKAAALTAEATGGSGADDGVTLAEEGPRSRRGTVLRVAAIALVLVVVAAGSSYAGYAWSQRQYYLAEQDGVVAVFRGVEQNLGPISLSTPEFATTIAIDDLPTSYQDSLRQGIEVDNRAAADVRVAELRLQATACKWAQVNGEVCRTVPATWTAPTPTPSPTASATVTPTPAPSSTFSPGATPSIVPTVPPTVPPGAVATGGPVTS
jgi:protein phosphatase